MKYVAIRMSGVFQSYGLDRGPNKPSLNHPTFSSLVGMVMSANGLNINDDSELKRVTTGIRYCEAFVYGNSQKVIDYQNVGGGHDLGNPYDACMVAPMRDGKKPGADFVNLQTHREYLSDADFGVILGFAAGYDYLIEGIKNPQQQVFLGKKCCIPSRELFIGEYDDYESTVSGLMSSITSSYKENREFLRERTLSQRIKYLVSGDSVCGKDDVVSSVIDFPLSFRAFSYAQLSRHILAVHQ